MLPKGWCAYQLNELMTFRNGLNYSQSDKGEEITIVGVADFQSRSSIEDTSQLQRIRVSSHVADMDLLTTGDLLFVRSNGNKALIGRCLYFPKVNERLSFSGFTIRGRADSSKLDSEFAAYLMRSSHVTAQMHLGGSGTNISNLSQEILNGVRLAVPALDEQRRIAAVLKTWDAAISATEKFLVSSRRQRDSLISKLLMPVPTTARGRSTGSSFPASVQPGIPQLPPTPPGWQKTTLDQLLKEVPRAVSLESEREYTLVTVRRSRGGVDERGVLLGREIKTPSQFWVKAGDFLISKRQIVHGACGIVPTSLDGAIVSNEYAVLNTRDGLDARFLMYLAETTYFQQTCFHSSIGVHVEKMIFKLDRWLTWPFNIPPIDVQRRIVAQLDLATDQIRSVENQLEFLKQEKRALMADLLTGKRRVRLPEATAEPKAA